MTLFEHHAKNELESQAPLATRMRPRSLDEFVGQTHLLDKECVLRKSIESDQLPSMVLWGPPGTGKTTLAYLIARLTKSHFSSVSAVASGVSDLRKCTAEASDRLGMQGQRTILFIDEIHRFNKSQQDVILPYVEDGTVVMIGATTENPSFEVIAPLLSRAQVFTLHSLTDGELEQVLCRALTDCDRGIGSLKPNLDKDAMNVMIKISGGDARIALNTLELVVSSQDSDANGVRSVSKAVIEDAMQNRALVYDKGGDQHYDTISAFIKSVRGSDPNAAVYWLARMIDSGEDPLFIARRLVILAAEDVGMAEPQALPVAIAAQQAVHFVGMPEGRIPLAEATIFIATSPKSNSAYVAINKAIADVKSFRNAPVPLHLRNAVTELMGDIGYGKGYKYSHNYTGNFAKMENLPENLVGTKYYTPGTQGFEETVSERLDKWWGSDDDADSSHRRGLVNDERHQMEQTD